MFIGYARVSTLGQSLDAQLNALNDCEELYQEKVSGAERNRPQLDYLLNHIKKGDVLVVTKLDRLARSTKDLLDIVEVLEKKKASLKIINMNLDTSTPTGRLMLTMLGAIAEFERTLMLERQSEGIVRAKAEGKYKGKKPSATLKVTEALTLRSNGLTRPEICSQLGISLASLSRIFKKQTQGVQNG